MREFSTVLRYAAGQRYLARIRAASRVREVFAVFPARRLCRCRCSASQRVRAKRAPRASRDEPRDRRPSRRPRCGPPNRATRRGASRPGRWRYLGGNEKIGSASAGLAVEGDHADLRWTLVAAIDHLLAHEAWPGIALNARRYVLAGQRGQGADGAERNDEKAERRLQHFSHSCSASLVIVCITGEFFRLMSPIVSIVSPGLIFRQKPVPALASVTGATN